MPEVVAYRLSTRTALLDDDRSLPITNLFVNGEETEETEDVTSFVCGQGDEWYAVDCAAFEGAVTQ